MSARITVLGLAGHPLTDEALAALASARLVVGGPRHLAVVRHLLPAITRTEEFSADLSAGLDALADEPGACAVVASGDPGFFGIVRALAERFGPEALSVLPEASSVSRAFARVGLAWDDAVVVTAHGRDPAPAVAACRARPKVAVLTETRFGPAALAAALTDRDRQLVVCEDLGGPGERIVVGSPEDIQTGEWSHPNVVLVLDPARRIGPKGAVWPARNAPTRWALPTDAFDHTEGLITKPDVRAVALARLGAGLGDVVWDVGAGSGSVAVEAARFGAAVTAVESDAEQSARIRANAEHHDVPVDVVEGTAPGALADLADPDAVFVGGGGHLLTEILRTAAERVRRVVVVTLATLERIAPARSALAEAGLEVEATMLQASALAPLGTGHRLAAGNPVVLVEGRRP